MSIPKNRENVMSTMIGFGKNDRRIMSGGDMSYYKGEKGRTDRVSFCWFFEDDDGNLQLGDDATPQMISAEIYYIKSLGYVLANDYLRDKMGPAKKKVGTFLVHYHTNRHGEVQKPFGYEIKPWTFSEDKYRKLASKHRHNNLTTHDLEIQCEDDNFQKLEFTAIPGEALWQRNDKVREEVLAQVKDLRDRLSLGREVPLEDLKDHFGDAVPLAPNHSSQDLDDLMDGIE
jgi:hypothetical protein